MEGNEAPNWDVIVMHERSGRHICATRKPQPALSGARGLTSHTAERRLCGGQPQITSTHLLRRGEHENSVVIDCCIYRSYFDCIIPPPSQPSYPSQSSQQRDPVLGRSGAWGQKMDDGRREMGTEKGINVSFWTSRRFSCFHLILNGGISDTEAAVGGHQFHGCY